MDRLRDGDDCGQRQLVGVVALVGLAAGAKATPVEDFQVLHVRELGPVEESGHLGRNLPRLRVNGLATAEDEVGALLLHGHGQRARGAERVGDGEDLVAQVDGRSAPMVRVIRSASSACGGPIVIVTTSPPCASRRRIASLTA